MDLQFYIPILYHGSQISRIYLIAMSYGSLFLNIDFLKVLWIVIFIFFVIFQEIIYTYVLDIELLICGGVLWITNLELWCCRRVP